MAINYHRGIKPLVNNNPCKSYKVYYCIECGSKELKPVRMHSSTGKCRGTWWYCEKCKKTNKEKKVKEYNASIY